MNLHTGNLPHFISLVVQGYNSFSGMKATAVNLCVTNSWKDYYFVFAFDE